MAFITSRYVDNYLNFSTLPRSCFSLNSALLLMSNINFSLLHNSLFLPLSHPRAISLPPVANEVVAGFLGSAAQIMYHNAAVISPLAQYAVAGGGWMGWYGSDSDSDSKSESQSDVVSLPESRWLCSPLRSSGLWSWMVDRWMASAGMAAINLDARIVGERRVLQHHVPTNMYFN